MTPEGQQAEHPYLVTIEIPTGQSANVPVAFLTSKQIESFLQSDFKRLVQEAGISGARVHVAPAMIVDYQKVLHELAAWLRTSTVKAA